MSPDFTAIIVDTVRSGRRIGRDVAGLRDGMTRQEGPLRGRLTHRVPDAPEKDEP